MVLPPIGPHEISSTPPANPTSRLCSFPMKKSKSSICLVDERKRQILTELSSSQSLPLMPPFLHSLRPDGDLFSLFRPSLSLVYTLLLYLCRLLSRPHFALRLLLRRQSLLHFPLILECSFYGVDFSCLSIPIGTLFLSFTSFPKILLLMAPLR